MGWRDGNLDSRFGFRMGFLGIMIEIMVADVKIRDGGLRWLGGLSWMRVGFNWESRGSGIGVGVNVVICGGL